MKKIIFGIVILMGLGLLVACGKKTNNNELSKDNQKTIAMQATTSLVMLNEMGSSAIKRARAMTTDEKNEVKKLLAQLDVILSNENNFNSSIVTSDLEEYEIKQQISFIDHTLENKQYELYYNELSVKEKIDRDDDDDLDEEEHEVTTTFEGIIIFEDNRYNISGKKEIETEGNESEEEIEFVIYYDETTFIKVNQEFELDNEEVEEEFRYRVYQDKKLTYEYMLEIEKEDKEIEIQLLLNNIYYEIDQFTENGKIYFAFKIKGEIGNQRILFEKVITTIDGITTVDYIEV